MGARDLVGRRPDVHALVVEDEVFDVDELAGKPKAVAGIGEMGPRDPAVPDRASGQPLVEPRDSIFCGRKRRRDQGPRNLERRPNGHARSI